MSNNELQNIWNSHNQKLDEILAINKDVARKLTKQNLDKKIRQMYLPKSVALLIGIPYAVLLIFITIITAMSQAYIMTVGFGAIALITNILLVMYAYQINLIGEVTNNDGVLPVQERLSKLRLSSFQSLRLAIFQLPFWSVCWISIDALKDSPFIYGGVNLLVFAGLTYVAYWIYNNVSPDNEDSLVRNFFLSGNEWDPIVQSSMLLEQIKEYDE